MFEETTLYHCSEVPSLPSERPKPQFKSEAPSSRLSQFQVVQYWHSLHLLYVRQWIAQGQVKIISKQGAAGSFPSCTKWFLYIEYKSAEGNNHYIQKSFSSLRDTIRYAETEALTQTLPYV